MGGDQTQTPNSKNKDGAEEEDQEVEQGIRTSTASPSHHDEETDSTSLSAKSKHSATPRTSQDSSSVRSYEGETWPASAAGHEDSMTVLTAVGAQFPAVSGGVAHSSHPQTIKDGIQASGAPNYETVSSAMQSRNRTNTPRYTGRQLSEQDIQFDASAYREYDGH